MAPLATAISFAPSKKFAAVAHADTRQAPSFSLPALSGLDVRVCHECPVLRFSEALISTEWRLKEILSKSGNNG
jgi:hypothetical protein